VSDRYVLVRVTDGEKVVVYSEKGMKEREVSVPEDDQLRQDLMLVTLAASNVACGRNPLHGLPSPLELGGVSYHDLWVTQDRLRAAFGLDTEDDNE